MKPIFVYVSLGKNKDELLMPFSTFANTNCPTARNILITDSPRKYKDFNGKVIRYFQTDRIAETMEALRRKKPFLKGIAGDYWFYTFERLLALQLLEGEVDSTASIIHLESDILSFIDEGLIETLYENYPKPAILRWGNYANAGVLFCRNIIDLSCFVDALHKIARDIILTNSWTIDMQILNYMLESSSVSELPTPRGESDGKLILSNDIWYREMRVICDSLDLGVYLFGRNSVYSGGKIERGYTYDHLSWHIAKSRWMFQDSFTERKIFRAIIMKYQHEEFWIPFLHINSKVNLVVNDLNLMKKLFPPNEWTGSMRFPQNGIHVASVHKISKLVQFWFRVLNKIRRF